jgi:hypothetical protein
MKIVDRIVDVALSIILFEGPQLHSVVAIEISNQES